MMTAGGMRSIVKCPDRRRGRRQRGYARLLHARDFTRSPKSKALAGENPRLAHWSPSESRFITNSTSVECWRVGVLPDSILAWRRWRCW